MGRTLIITCSVHSHPLVQLHGYMKIHFTTDPKPKGIPPSAFSGTFSLENPVQKAEPLRCLPLRTRSGRLKALLSNGNSPYPPKWLMYIHGNIMYTEGTLFIRDLNCPDILELNWCTSIDVCMDSFWWLTVLRSLTEGSKD